VTCEECGAGFTPGNYSKRARFCSAACRYRKRDRERYARDPEGERAKSRAYYAANRERVLARMKARAAS
jgi:hypothetical protein